jgi:Right handed beta helix region
LPALVLGMLLSCLPSQSRQATYYVSLSGSDQGPGTLARPFRTIHRGLAELRPGATLRVRAGTYQEALLDDIPSGTSWSAPVSIAAHAGETVTLRPSGTQFVLRLRGSHRYIAFTDFVFDATLVTDSAIYISSSRTGSPDHIRISRSEVKNAPHMGIIVEAEVSRQLEARHEFLNLNVHDNGTTPLDHGFYIQANHNLIQGCDIHHNAGNGIQIYKKGTVAAGRNASHNTICGNKAHDNGRTKGRGVGIGLYVGDGNMAFNNLVWNNQIGIAVEIGASNSKVLNNTIYNNKGDAGIRVGYTGPGVTANTTIRNNIIYGNERRDIADFGTGTVADHNLPNRTDPLFANPKAGDFHLQLGSPAIKTGVALGEVRVDCDGVSRPKAGACDLGAYQYHDKRRRDRPN